MDRICVAFFHEAQNIAVDIRVHVAFERDFLALHGNFIERKLDLFQSCVSCELRMNLKEYKYTAVAASATAARGTSFAKSFGNKLAIEFEPE